nr:MAG: minor tail protein [Bacteriophage sp.]
MDGSVVIEAILDTSKIEKGVKDVNSTLSSVSWKGIKEGDAAAQKLSGSLKTAGTAATVGLTAPIVAAGAAAFSTAASYEQATARIQSALGLTAEEAERLGDVGEGIYENGFGASLDAVSDALITVRQNLGDLNDQDLEYVTQAALTLSDTLGMDVGESVRGVNALMDGFGLSAQDAMDLFVAGAQDGLNYSGELGDNLAEYGPRFAQMGFSAEEYFSILKTGSENGAYSLDKVNDFLNEFQTSLADGRMDEQIGRFSESTQQLFESWKQGGATGQQVFEAVMGELAQMPDGYEKANIASELWSSLGEDNAMGMITSLAGVENKYGDVAGAAVAAADAASDSFAGKAQSAMRELQGAIEPLGQPLLNIATNVAGVVRSFGEWFDGIGEGGQMAVLAIAGILAAIGPVLSVAGNLVTVIPAITAALSGAGGAAGLFGGALTALTGPVGIVVGVLAGLTAAIVYLWNTNEGFRTAVSEAWNAIWGTIQGVIAQLQPYVQQAWEAISNAVTQAMNVIMPIVSGGFQFIIAVAVPILQQLLQNVGNTFQVILSTITGVMNGIAQIIQGAWSLIQGIFQTVLGLINGIVTGDFSQMQAGIQGIMSGITGIISGAWNVIVSVVGGAINGVVTTVQNGLNTALSVVQGIFNGIESAIDGAMNGAKNIVSGVIDAIKGFFNFRISWPHIPLPHIHYELIEVPLLGQIPNPATLSVEWYAKGGIFNGPSVIGVGEAGPEAVVPLSGSRAQPFADAIADALAEKVGGIAGARDERGGCSMTFNFYQPIKSPDEVARAVRLSERYGLAAEI